MLRPQPLGIFPLPASYLVLPDVDGAAAFAGELLRGNTPDAAPEPLGFYLLALAGDVDAAWQACDETMPEGRYNRFVLRGEPDVYAALQNDLHGVLRMLLDVAAYTLGLIDAPPAPGDADGELRAVALMAQAAHAFERDDGEQATGALLEAIDAARRVSPLLAAHLLGNLADARLRFTNDAAQAIQHYREALRLLDKSGLHEVRAHFALNLGMLYHDLSRGQRGALLEAVKCYQEAIQVFSRESAPELYALAHNNLALAYLAMPLTEASDQLRMGIAVQSLREALKVYTLETHPELWASAQLNLANALQYLPSTNPQDHLVEAIELYEQVLSVRDRDHDPLGYARVLANQGNALAHLGIFVHAKPKLQEALRIFTAYADQDAAQSLRGVLDEINGSEQASKEQHGTVPTPAV